MNINSISCNHNIIYDFEDNKNICYIINEGYNDEKVIYIKSSNNISNTIVKDDNNYINGYKIVKTADNKYSFVREVDNKLLPYRYDIVTNFNKYGYAMVGKNGKVSWIDTKFRYLDINGNMVIDTLDDEFNGYNLVNKFSNGNIPISRITRYNGMRKQTSYINSDGEIMEFNYYNDKLDSSIKVKYFNNGTDFNDNGYARSDNNILFAKGYFCTFNSLIDICEDSGLLDTIDKKLVRK